MSLFGGLVDAVGGFLGASAEKKQTKNVLRDYNAAQEGSVNALTGARDASLGYYQPYMAGGGQAFQNALNMQTGGFQYSPNDPSYQWRFDQGMEGALRGASAGGSRASGGTLKALTRYGQGLASTEFQNDFARNNTLAQYGMEAARGSADVQGDFARGVTNALFAGADGRTGARYKRGEAIKDQWGAGADAVGSVAAFFGF